MSYGTTNLHWLRVAIHMCGGRRSLAEQCGIKVGRITEWLNETRGITLENAIKIEYAVNSKVNRFQLVSSVDTKIKKQLINEFESLQNRNPTLTFLEKVALGLAHEAALGCRKGARTDLKPSKNFYDVALNDEKKITEISTLRGRTEKLAAKLAGFGNFITYHQAKKIVKHGSSQLIDAVEKGLPISRAVRICEHDFKKQQYFLTLDRSLMLKSLDESEQEKKFNTLKKTNSSNTLTEENSNKKNILYHIPTAAWALICFSNLFQNKLKQEPSKDQTQDIKTEIISNLENNQRK